MYSVDAEAANTCMIKIFERCTILSSSFVLLVPTRRVHPRVNLGSTPIEQDVRSDSAHEGL